MLLEGRGWMKNVFYNFKARPVSEPKKDKFYIYQMYYFDNLYHVAFV